MKENIVTFQVAKLAKEKGFGVDTGEYWVETLEHELDIPRSGIEKFPSHKPRILGHKPSGNFHIIHGAPTQALLQKWLREIHNIDIIIWKNGIDGSYRVEDILLNNKELTDLEFEDSFDNYENALEEGLYEALKLI